MPRRAATHHLLAGERLRARGAHTDVVGADGTVRRTIAPTPAAGSPFAPRSEWVAWASWRNDTDTSLTEFRASWVVPNAPRSPADQTIYLFPGLQDDHRSLGGTAAPNILQPVLTWSRTDAGAPQGWSIASWYVRSDDQGFLTASIPVQPGDRVEGAMRFEQYHAELDRYDYRCEFVGHPETVLRVELVEQLVGCSVVLECAQLSACDQFPDDRLTTFDGITIATEATHPATPWQAAAPWTPCGQRAEIVSASSNGGTIRIHY